MDDKLLKELALQLWGGKLGWDANDKAKEMLPWLKALMLQERIDELLTYKTNLPDVDSTEVWLDTRLKILKAQLKGGK
jgi:hypothetical protein